VELDELLKLVELLLDDLEVELLELLPKLVELDELL